MAFHESISFLHRHLWQRLPRSWRRAALFHAATLVAPRPSPKIEPAAPIIVAGVFDTASGLGESARLCYDALKMAGVSVFGIDLTAALMQPSDVPGFAFVDGRSCEGPGTLILHVNSPLVPLAMWQLGRWLVAAKFIVGYWAWELPEVPPDWRHGIPFVHEIWVPSRFVAEAIRPLAAGRPIHVVPHPVALANSNGLRPPRPSDNPFSVLTVFNAASSFARKNPCAAIKAFRTAFGDDPTTRLIVKGSNLSSFPQAVALLKEAANSAPNVVVMDEIMSAAGIGSLYDKADVFISLHRSEGFGLTIAMAMLLGLPVIATGWSGNVDFLNDETGIPVHYRLIPARDEQGTYHHPNMMWAEPDIDDAAAALRRLRADPLLRTHLATHAAQFAARTWSPEAYTHEVRKVLRI
jgi:glycosyltransferase involved in cell wall biosynthesis